MMRDVYDYYGISRQAASQACQRLSDQLALELTLTELVRDIREDHPRMGLRKIYHKLKPLPIGRDRFEELMMLEKLFVTRVRLGWKTTVAQRYLKYPNLLDGQVLTGPHQAWVTDISYFSLPSRFAYLIVIMDVYTRVILSAHASLSLKGEQNLLALQPALEASVGERGERRTIHHSDRGSQYIDTDYLDALEKARMDISMCTVPQENAYVERVIGTLKNEYLQHLGIRTLDDLRTALARTVFLYNEDRPHSSLPQWRTPKAFSEMVLALPAAERPPMRIHQYSDVQGGA
jgi:putative transposase